MRGNSNIADYIPFSTVDCPEGISFVLFLSGCPNRCTFCHNIELFDIKTKYSWESIEELLSKRRKLLDIVIFSGGEPLLTKDLNFFLERTKNLGLKTGIHTSGVLPEYIDKNSIYNPKVLDWVGLDIKAPLSNPNLYMEITKNKNLLKDVKLTIDILQEKKIKFETRTTLTKELLNKALIEELCLSLKEKGIENFVLQACRDINLKNIEGTDKILDNKIFIESLSKLFKTFSIRK